MTESQPQTRPNTLRTLMRGGAIGASAVLAVLGAFHQQSHEPNKTAIAAISRTPERPKMVAPKSAIQQFASSSLDERLSRRASRSTNRAPLINTMRSCWDGTEKDLVRTTKENIGNIATACALAKNEPWANENFAAQIDALVTLWDRESGWNPESDNSHSSAHGIPQALPGSKMGEGWQHNAQVQIAWGLNYITDRYQTPQEALDHWKHEGWY